MAPTHLGGMNQFIGDIMHGAFSNVAAAAASPRRAAVPLGDGVTAAAASGTTPASDSAPPLLPVSPSDAVAPWGLPPALDLAVLVEAAEKLDLLLLAPLLPVIHHFLWLLPLALSNGEGSLPQQQQQQQPSRCWLSPQLAASIARLLRLRNHPALMLRNQPALSLPQGTASQASPDLHRSTKTGPPGLGLAATCALCILEELHERLAVLGLDGMDDRTLGLGEDHTQRLGNVDCTLGSTHSAGKDGASIQGAIRAESARGVSAAAAAAEGSGPGMTAGVIRAESGGMSAADSNGPGITVAVRDDAAAAEDAAALAGCSVAIVRLALDLRNSSGEATAITRRCHQVAAGSDCPEDGESGPDVTAGCTAPTVCIAAPADTSDGCTHDGGGLSSCDPLIDTRFLELCCPSLAEACRTLERSAAVAAGVCGGGSGSGSQGGPQGGTSKAAAVVPRKLSVRPIGAVGSPSSSLASPSKLPSFGGGSGATSSSAPPPAGDLPESLRKMLHPDDGIDGPLQQVRL